MTRRSQRAIVGFRLEAVLAFVLTLFALALPHRAFAADSKSSTCDGPPECCPAALGPEEHGSVHAVEVGVVLIGIYDINEKASSWTADFYLYEQWSKSTGFVPQTEIVNETNRISEQFDETELRGDRCVRTRRIRSTLHTSFNLRTFPFDRQDLTLDVSDAKYESREVEYPQTPKIAGLDDSVLHQLSGWKVISGLTHERTRRAFKWDEGSPDYDHATFSVSVRRHVSYHLARYFLPLLLIVVVAFSVFWIDPDDLSSELTIGVTCLLAAIALQFAEASSLPDVSYLTIADRAYSICYVAIGLAVLQTIYTNRLARGGKRNTALLVDRYSRIAFPALLVFATVIAIVRAVTQTA